MERFVGGEWVGWMQWLTLALPADSPSTGSKLLENWSSCSWIPALANSWAEQWENSSRGDISKVGRTCIIHPFFQFYFLLHSHCFGKCESENQSCYITCSSFPKFLSFTDPIQFPSPQSLLLPNICNSALISTNSFQPLFSQTSCCSFHQNTKLTFYYLYSCHILSNILLCILSIAQLVQL